MAHILRHPPEGAEACTIASLQVRRQMGCPDLVIPIELDCLGRTVSTQPVSTLTHAQASIEHEQLVGQLQALVALRDYLPLHIYHHASNHLFGMDELKSASLMPQLRPELSNLRAYAAGNIELSKSLFLELDRHLHEVLAPRLDELGMRRYGPAWPTAPDGCFPELQTPENSAPPSLHCAEQQRRRSSAQEAWEGKPT